MGRHRATTADDRTKSAPGNRTRALSLMSALRVNSGTTPIRRSISPALTPAGFCLAPVTAEHFSFARFDLGGGTGVGTGNRKKEPHGVTPGAAFYCVFVASLSTQPPTS